MSKTINIKGVDYVLYEHSSIRKRDYLYKIYVDKKAYNIHKNNLLFDIGDYATFYNFENPDITVKIIDYDFSEFHNYVSYICEDGVVRFAGSITNECVQKQKRIKKIKDILK